jgi:dipeptidyl aminopeptidase/acylaminoacyl peptidase
VDDAKVISRLVYRRDQSGYRPSGYRHLFVVPVQGGTPRQISSGDFDHSAPQWTSDDSELVCDGKRFEDADWQSRESDLYAFNVQTGTVRTICDRKGSDTSPLVLGDTVVFIGNDASGATYEMSSVFKVPLRGGTATGLTEKFDRSINAVARIRPGVSDAVLCTYEDRGGIRAARLALDGSNPAPLSGTDGWFRATSILADGAVLGFLTTPTEPGTIALRRGEKYTALTAVHDDVLHGKQLATLEEVTWKSTDGLDIQGWLLKPPGFDPARKYPLVLQIHGGPHAAYGVNFDFERQWFAAKDYLYFYTNPRGSTGYGRDFTCAIQNSYPGKDYDDLMTGIDAVIAKGSVDTSNLFVYGGSGGGVLTCWIVGSTSRFRAAVSMFPVTNWISFVGTTDGVDWYRNFEKLPWEDIGEHWRRSPLRLVGNVTTPTMMMTGELDLRTPMSQTEEYYQALKLRKIDSVLVRVQDEFHGAGNRHPSNRMRRMLYVQQWFERHKSEGAKPIP